MRKNKLLKRIAIIVGVLFAFYLVARISGGFRMYKSQTSANSPGIEPEDYIFVSNWVSYERFDFVCYEGSEPIFGPGIFTHRLCGLPGDTLEIRNGDLIVNGNNTSKVISVKHNYMVPRSASYRIRDIAGYEYVSSPDPYSDSLSLALESRIIEPWMQARQITDSNRFNINKRYPSDWTLDNFGPIIIGEGEVFLIGDNRNNSIDSRTNGPVKETDIVGVVLNKN